MPRRPSSISDPPISGRVTVTEDSHDLSKGEMMRLLTRQGFPRDFCISEPLSLHRRHRDATETYDLQRAMCRDVLIRPFLLGRSVPERDTGRIP